ncbi:hypothetical protein SAY86_025249 [Trapa natans]|uniref:BIRD-IDD transcription factor fourth C2HC zinc finger domain-containing protein n=1 Tax=Trapa natans TaxID=22666 RepID=A0AAN7M6U5_TRANT|nr:hypothetical protein SAY86_025249 [Trapa natans]
MFHFHGCGFSSTNSIPWKDSWAFHNYGSFFFFHNRRDSFITHRAFCDALAEENARFSAVAPPNIHFRSDASLPPGLPQGFGNRGAHDIAGISQLGSMLRPDSGGMVNLAGSSLGAVQQPKSSMLSLWLNQTSPHFAGPGELQPSSNLFGPSSSSALPLPDMLQMSSPSNFFSSSPIPSFGGYNQFLSANLSLSSLKEEAGNKANLSDQAPSLATYGDCPSTQLKADMSATALLQKAAQLGSSRSNRSPMFGNMFGAMMSNSSTYQQIPPPHLGPIPENNFGGGGSQPNNLCSTTRPASSGGGLDQATHHHMKLMNQSGGGGGGGSSSSATMDHHNSLTRDFLGVSGAAGQPFSPQDLAKLASMSSAMGDLSQLDGNNQ